MFYGKLFEIDPFTKSLFAGVDMSAQSKKLTQAINIAVANLDQLETLLPAIEELGKRHAGYGVRDEHYESVGTALLWALHENLGERFTPEVEKAWTLTYFKLANTMREAVAEM